jgi:hypothetical protein
MRLKTIDYHYFERIFSYLISSPQIESVFFADKKILTRKIDSTLVTLSAKLLHFGMRNRKYETKSVKYTLELSQGLPVNLILFTDQDAFSEDIALPAMIKKKPNNSKVNIAIFDRGVQRKTTFTSLVDNNIYFISRTNKHVFRVVEDLPIEEVDTKTLKIISIQIVQFCRKKNSVLPQKLRLITGKSKENGQLIRFITNVDFLSAAEITDLYKSRWEIEAFFRFIKQELNFSHLISRTENGVRVVMYLTMITAILLTLYKKVNHIIGWAVAKIRFMDELESDIFRQWHLEMASVFTKTEIPQIYNSS